MNYFFLRADQVTRNTPIILVSAGHRLAQQAEILGADGYVERGSRPLGIDVWLLTPPSIVAVLRAGYPPSLHPSCQ